MPLAHHEFPKGAVGVKKTVRVLHNGCRGTEAGLGRGWGGFPWFHASHENRLLLAGLKGRTIMGSGLALDPVLRKVSRKPGTSWPALQDCRWGSQGRAFTLVSPAHQGLQRAQGPAGDEPPYAPAAFPAPAGSTETLGSTLVGSRGFPGADAFPPPNPVACHSAHAQRRPRPARSAEPRPFPPPALVTAVPQGGGVSLLGPANRRQGVCAPGPAYRRRPANGGAGAGRGRPGQGSAALPPRVSAGRMEAEGVGAPGRGLPAGARREAEGSIDCPNLDFEYGDADSHAAELAELYSYTEGPEFALNRKCFEEDFQIQAKGRRWSELGLTQQKTYVMRLLDGLEVVSRDQRLKVARAVLYLAQGVFGECDTEADVLCWARHNSFLLYQMGTFTAFLELLNMEVANTEARSSALRKPAISLADSTELRVILTVMYLMVENIRVKMETDPPKWTASREMFRAELSYPIHSEESFGLLLFTMVTKFCSEHSPHFPMKKVLLLLWKVLVFTLGGFDTLQAMKVKKRQELGLPPLPEDSIQVMRNMRAASPLAYAPELEEQPQPLPQKRGHRNRRPLMKQDSLDIYNERDPFKNEEAMVDEEDPDDNANGLEGDLDILERGSVVQAVPLPCPPVEKVSFPKGLPWAPQSQVRQKDIEHFLETSRNKFIGFTLGQDTDTLVGLPCPIHESVKTLKEHKYISVAEVQIKNEEEMEKWPISLGEEDVQETPCEVLYRAMLYNLPQYMIALLKILLAAAPTSKAKTDSINILADVLPEEMPVTVLQSMKLGIDVNRHKEIIVKSIAASLLLLLKHFRLNHIYQFEYVAQHLVFANCIPLILKFFNQNIMSYITAKNRCWPR
ncbi:striatin-interacting protein 2 [Crotalus adamanteus]|uniref:Striatin-interacting protein 2 n=1 Tax=Crotalus adamanteus TaxID=8729 RepID=A0AAW1BEE6_CROAD